MNISTMPHKTTVEVFNLGNNQLTSLTIGNLITLFLGVPLLVLNRYNSAYDTFPYVFYNLLSLLLATSISVLANSYFGKTGRPDFSFLGIKVFNTMVLTSCVFYLASFYFFGHNMIYQLGTLNSNYFDTVLATYGFNFLFTVVTLMSMVTFIRNRTDSPYCHEVVNTKSNDNESTVTNNKSNEDIVVVKN